ncbi:D-2-hydroxyacid dehydrogenase family protein [uncultured Bifidobacterium sp.]|uniref:D-2-hydroxyacid dehydrogenase family protein n=1 Tax=uncultured Bifidobacterium sp. TaxID=165187 RepID=UPI0025899C7A|nr:D-2-hydroxyacid dehydrogenase family protein [uncultured Bifidobacterium sp.]MEE0654824.1 D-2-hydroxyacid dehydrogenase family protein [Bifidobacterium criceti]
MNQIYETQADRTDLPLVAIPCVFEDMVAPLKDALALLDGIARVRMFEDYTLDANTFVERAQGADAVIVIGVHISDDMLRALANTVRCMAFGGTGVASYIDFDLARELNVRVCNVRHYGDAAVAEFTFALILELARRVGDLDRELRAGDWNGVSSVELAGKTLAIVGFGGIGQTVARIAQGFGMHVTAWNSGRGPRERYTEHNVTPIADMKELFASADVVSIHMPLVDGTRGMIGSAELDALRPGTMFVNTARAEIIAPGALVKRLERGDIPAGLDVYCQEPLPTDSPLLDIPGLVLTPHVAWRSDGANRNLTRQCVEDIAAYFEGGKKNVVVDPDEA